MAPLKKEEIDRIAERVVSLLNKENNQVNIVSTIGNGIFTSVDSAVNAAAIAQKKFVDLPLEKRVEIISNIRKEMLNYTEELAKMAWDETGMGRLEDKIQKNRLVINKTPGIEILKPDASSGDHGLTLMELAPHGVIGSITPSTNPTSTIICNTIGMLAAGNSVVFNAHPNAKKVSIYNIQLLNKAITEAGGPENVVTTVESPTIQTASELMKHPGINLLVVTGGEAVVKAAMESGKRAICAGPGNPPVVVDETADIENAAKCIVKGASLDNNIICVLEKEIFAVESIADQLLDAFSRNNAIVLSEEQITKLDKVLFTEQKGPGKPGVINKNYIGKNIQVILKEIGVDVSPDIRMAVAPVKEDHPLVWTEQLLPVIPLVRVPDVD
ncbi:MAG: aldehyde dehydrogenase, partial [Candidatus Aminicenantes bacterium]|nr:aldehyde dehydrogenase [Candidatus Aminicenantes bacterium]